jgi:hypothetical protein
MDIDVLIKGRKRKALSPIVIEDDNKEPTYLPLIKRSYKI